MEDCIIIDRQNGTVHVLSASDILAIIIIHTFLYRCKVVTSEAVAEVRSRQSLSVIMSQVKQVSFKPRFKNCQRRTVKYCPRK